MSDDNTDILEQEIRRLNLNASRLDRALLIASGIISTHPNWANTHPGDVYEMLLGKGQS